MRKPTLDEETFARMLEGAASPRSLDERRMGALVAALERSRPEPSKSVTPDFAAALRNRIIAEAEKAARLPLRERAIAAVRVRTDAWRRSFRVVTAAGLAAMMLLGTGAAFASARNSLPGQWNYSLKRAKEGAQMAVTPGALRRGYVHLDFARTRLNEVTGLAAANVGSDGLYIDTLNDMDAATLAGTELLVRASRTGAGLTPLNRLSRFASAQRLRLESLVERVPAGARPAARDSLDVLTRVGTRVDSIIAGCPCPGNALEIPTALQGGSSQPSVPCSCSNPAGSAGGNGDAEGDSTDTNAGGPGDTTGGDSGGGGGTPPAGTDLVGGTDVDQPANDVVDDVNDLLEDLGLPTVAPSPVPVPAPAPSVGL